MSHIRTRRHFSAEQKAAVVWRHLGVSSPFQACSGIGSSVQFDPQLSQQERGHRRADGGERSHKRRTWGALKEAWVPHDTQDEIVDYIRYWAGRTELPAKQLLGLGWLELAVSKFHTSIDCYGKPTEHNE